MRHHVAQPDWHHGHHVADDGDVVAAAAQHHRHNVLQTRPFFVVERRRWRRYKSPRIVDKNAMLGLAPHQAGLEFGGQRAIVGIVEVPGSGMRVEPEQRRARQIGANAPELLGRVAQDEFHVRQRSNLGMGLGLVLRVDFDRPHPLEVLRSPAQGIALERAGFDEQLESAGLRERQSQIGDRRSVD